MYKYGFVWYLIVRVKNNITDSMLFYPLVVPDPVVITFQESDDDNLDQDYLSICLDASARLTDMAPHPHDCTKFIACQAGSRAGSWIATIRECSPGTVFDQKISRCNFRDNVTRCQTGELE